MKPPPPPPPAHPAVTAVTVTAVDARSASASPARPGTLDSDGLVQLPDIPVPPLSSVSTTPAPPPAGGRECGVPECPGFIGVSFDGGPPPDHGFCPECGTPYSFRPQLAPGDEIGEPGGQRYGVVGYLSRGGTSWVYLARDTALENQFVVLKAQIHNSDAIARRRAVEEMRSLASLHHRDIVSVISSRSHQPPGEQRPTDYIVMEYVGGRPLNSLLSAGNPELAELFGEPFALDHVLTYGCKILGAMEYLHDQELLYCDMKPANVIHYGRQVKVIDLGAVRRADDRTSRLSYTKEFAPGREERERRGFHVDSDLYTVGRTLEAMAARAAPGTGLAASSFERLIARATHPDPAARFTSAPQMSRQLWEVLREHRALSRRERHPERSTRFEPTGLLFGAELGTVPEARYWTARAGLDTAAPPDLPVAPPEPWDAAAALPAPIPDPADPAVVFLARAASALPERVEERVAHEARLRTVEVALWLCRAYLRRGGEEAAALSAGWLDTAERLMRRQGVAPGYDWRPAWHRGLGFLTADRVADAQESFSAVYDIVPGEWAPKLALGYCAERLEATRRRAGGGHSVEELYQAVWERDRGQGSAAFGLARRHLRAGAREAAVTVLDQVPSTSRHYDTAQVAAVRALTARLAGVPAPPSALRQAAERVERLRPDGERDRLAAEVRENVLAAHFPPLLDRLAGRAPVRTGLAARLWGPGGAVALAASPRRVGRQADGRFPELPPGVLFEGADSAERLARLLYRSLRGLADQRTYRAERGDLLDRAYTVRPESTF
ncbi:tetratricopeptide repeat protein [Actinacidiphila yeochonensis]|uniref:tetratricopeptide repeat protein n=1 Tax=Actinacidiphila yeochonensis TaxID=89050 RepID=UPI000AE0E42A|nr:tetratricopeptide repeat protein [Actinacidiphila yeochonensis]